jgi:hypothetical protein
LVLSQRERAGRKSNNSTAFIVGNKTSTTFAESRSWKDVIKSVAARQKLRIKRRSRLYAKEVYKRSYIMLFFLNHHEIL